MVAELFREYFKELAVDLSFQNVEEELGALPGKYARSEKGVLFLAKTRKSEVAGCIALRNLGGGFAEVKRMFVRPGFR